MVSEMASFNAICELLVALQSSEDVVRKKGEALLDEAISGTPNQLVSQLTSVLAARDPAGGAPAELRQQAAVLLRRCIVGNSSALPAIWSDLDQATQERLKTQLLASIQQDSCNPVRRNAGSAAAAIAELQGDDMEELNKEWPEILPALDQFVSAASETPIRVTSLGVLKELAATIGAGLLAQGPQAVTMLQACLADAAPEVKAASAQLLLQLVEDLDQEPAAVLGPSMAGVIAAIEGFAQGGSSQEELLKETLQSLISAAEEEPEFFHANGLPKLWPLLLQLCTAKHFGIEDIRHNAMEAAVTLTVGLVDEFVKAEGQPGLEQILTLNVEWMLEVEEDVEAWTHQADAEDDEELDDDVVQIGEENLDRLADQFAEAKQLEPVFLPCLFKVIRACIQQNSWKHTRSAVMAVHQVAEHIEEEEWIDQCVEFIAGQLEHQHPRVRYSGFQAVGQVAYDHEPYVQENHHALLLSAIVKALEDKNVRVVISAATSFVSLGEELDREQIEPHIEDLMTRLLPGLQCGEARALQEQCLAGIAVVGEVAEELFEPYYPHVMPVMKRIIAEKTAEADRPLRGKAFETVSLIGEAVGKEMFLPDAKEVMQVMVQPLQVGFAADDKTREYMHEAAGRIAQTLEKEFKPFVPALLSGIFGVLSQRPQEVDRDTLSDDEDNGEQDMSLMLLGDKVVGLKTALLDEMKESLGLITALIKSLEDDYCEFLPNTCQNLLPLLEFSLSEEVREAAFKTWEAMAECAREAKDHGKCTEADISGLVSKFLDATVKAMGKAPEGDKLDETALSALQAQAAGASSVLRKAGKGVLTQNDVMTLMNVLATILGRVSVGKDEKAEMAGTKHRGKGSKADSDDEDEDEDAEENRVTRQSVRFSLTDVAGALMRSNKTDFVAVALPTMMQMVERLLSSGGSDADRSLALYVAEDVVECLGEASIPYWNKFMETACRSITDKSPAVRQYACGTIGAGAKQAIFSQIAPMAAQQLGKLLQKHGERHRRRRPVTAEAKQIALSVDAGIRAFGQLCEHQEANLGGDKVEAWSFWLSHLPLRYDEEEGQKAHHQLLELVVRQHPVVTAPQQLPKVLAVFADIYRTHFSNTVLDKELMTAVARAGPANIQQFGAGLLEKQQKKLEHMLKDGSAAQERLLKEGSQDAQAILVT